MSEENKGSHQPLTISPDQAPDESALQIETIFVLEQEAFKRLQGKVPDEEPVMVKQASTSRGDKKIKKSEDLLVHT